MSLNLATLLEAPIIEFDTIDSTNNYAMQLIDADKALPGLTIVAKAQSNGKGQRGRNWVDTPGESLLMSVISVPGRPLSEQFTFSASVAVAIANVLQKTYKNLSINIKWPNDIIVNDKKAGGILIENVLRGSNWLYCIVGFGLNIGQTAFPEDLPYATSLKIATGEGEDISKIRDEMRRCILECTSDILATPQVMDSYNGHLYKKGQKQRFTVEGAIIEGTILRVNSDGTLQVQLNDGQITNYVHGQVIWSWG